MTSWWWNSFLVFPILSIIFLAKRKISKFVNLFLIHVRPNWYWPIKLKDFKSNIYLEQKDVVCVTYLSCPFHIIHFLYQTSSTHFMYKVQLIHFVIHFHLFHFTDHSPSHSHSPYLVLLILFNQSRLWKLGVSLDKMLISNIYFIFWSWTLMVLLLLVNS